MLEKLKDLTGKIEQWAIDRGIDKNGTVEAQECMTAEEMSELISGINKNKIDLIKDSIGDTYVTLVVGSLIENSKTLEELVELHDSPERIPYIDKVEATKVGLVVLVVDTLQKFLVNTGYDSAEGLSDVLDVLIALSNYYELNFEDCVESAYNEIANRKGKMINGKFVKESDLEDDDNE